MSTIRRVVARARRRLVFVGCLLGLAVTAQNATVFAEDPPRPAVPDPSTWASETEETAAPTASDESVTPAATDEIATPTGTDESATRAATDETAAAPAKEKNSTPSPAESDSTDARPPVAKMVWKTVTSPSGRTFQVLEPATPEDIEAARRAESGDADDASAAGGEDAPTGTSGGDVAMIGDPGTRPGGRRTVGDPTALGHWMSQGGAPQITAFGVYGGYSSTAGLQMTLPTDGTLAFRMGLTGFPAVGWLWTPGVELRFGQEPGRYNTDGVYGFSNLYVGQTLSDDPDTDHWGVETGAGYRWILPDRRGVRWIAAIEVGGRWSPESSAPKTPAVRAFWMVAAP